MGRIFQYINRFPFLISFFLSRSAPVRLIFERWTRHDGYWKKYFSDIYKRYKSPPKLFYIIFLRLIINFFYYVRLSRGIYMYYIHACKFMHVLCVCFLFPYLVICFDNFLYIIIHLFSDQQLWFIFFHKWWWEDYWIRELKNGFLFQPTQNFTLRSAIKSTRLDSLFL